MRISGITYENKKKVRRSRKFWKILVIVFVLAVLLVAIPTIVGAWKMLHPPRQSVDFLPDTNLDYRPIKFMDSKEEFVLDGWFFENNNNKDTVILVHGNGEYRLAHGGSTIKLIEEFAKEDYSILAFDLRNSGTSEGSLSTFGSLEKYDILGAITYVKNQGAENITLLGFSTGASASLMAALEDSSNIDAIIADTPYEDMNMYLQKHFEESSNLPLIPYKWTVPYAIRLFPSIDKENIDLKTDIHRLSNIPILFIHSQNDTVISQDSSMHLYNNLTGRGGKGVFLKTNAPGHAQSFIADPDKYISDIKSFLKEVPLE